MSIASMATTPITPDSGVSFNDMNLSVHNGQSQGLCDWSHGAVSVPVPSQVQGRTQLRPIRLAPEYDFGTGGGMDMDTGLDMDMTLDQSQVPRNDQDQLAIKLSLDTSHRRMNLNLVEIMERTEGLAVVSPVDEELNMEGVEDYFDRDE